MAQTPDGYLWIGTQDGLARFDGASFTVFDHSNTAAFQSNNITALENDGAGGLWIGTEGSGLIHLSGGIFTRVEPPTGMTIDNIRALYRDKSGSLWICPAQENKLACVLADPVNPSALRMRMVIATSGSPTAVCEDKGGTIWYGTHAGGLYSIEGNKPRPFASFPGSFRHRIYSILCDHAGAIWIGTEGEGLLCLDHGALKKFGAREGLPESNIYCLLEDHRGSMWAGSYGGGLYQMEGDHFSRHYKSNGLTNDVIVSLFEDAEQNIWVGTNGGGLNQLRQGLFIPYGLPEGLSEEMVACVLETRDGAIWAGTYGGGLNCFKNGHWSAFTTRDGLCDNTVYALAEGLSGELWIGTGHGACRLSNGRFTVVTDSQGLPSNMIYAIACAPDGAVWFATGRGAASYRNGLVTKYTEQNGLLSHTVVSLHVTKDGRVLAGTYLGLHLLRDGRAEPVATIGSDHPEVFAIHETNDGSLWLATYGQGLLRYKDGLWAKVDSTKGLFNDYIYQVLEDGSGNFWMTCNKGIFCASREELERAAAGGPPVHCRIFGKDDGLRSPECNGGTQPAGCVAKDGRIWFPTIKGLAVLDPAGFKPEPAPAVVFEQLSYDRKPVVLSPSVKLPPGRGDLEIHFTAPSFTAPMKQAFKFRLNGYDSDWIETSDRRTAYYTNIPPGSYTFEVLAASKDGVWSTRPAALSIIIAPHFYQTTAFYVFCFALVALAAWGAYLFRVRQLKARQRELEALVGLRTADLQRALATVQQQGRELESFNKELEQKVREQLETILRSKRLTKYFPRKLVDSILGSSRDAELRTERRLITIFFTDMAGFTALTEVVEPDRLTSIINGYLTEMASIIEGHGGTLARFMGDGILGFFGTPDEMAGEAQAENAVRMAIAMQAKMSELRSLWRAEGLEQKLELRIGIHQDIVAVGNFGSPDHMEYTALGRGINLAKRLETACPPGKILVSAAIHDTTRLLFSYGQPEMMQFKGFAAPLPVYTLEPERQ
jgi:ligand-binding sensor domain-containing protein/class 3 adenylate cyclase